MVKEIIILALVDDGPRHGYEIKKDLEIIYGNRDYLNNNQLYPTLHRFEEEGLLERRPDSPAKSNRILYSITEAGRRHLMEQLSHFGEAEVGKEDEFLTRVSMFDRLSLEEREWILRLRRHKLEERIRHGDEILAHYGNDKLLSWPWGREVLRFRGLRMKVELDWIEELLQETIDGGGKP